MVEVCGVKFKEGIGKKSGKPYKGYFICYTEDGKLQGYDGYVTGDSFIPDDLVPGRPIMVGDKLNLVYDKSGFLRAVEFC